MDNDPLQTSAKAMAALKKLCITLQHIPPRPPDLNPIENMFNIVRRMREDAKNKKITRETWEQFVTRVKTTILLTSKDYIDKTSDSMSKRINQIIRSKGKQIKY